MGFIHRLRTHGVAEQQVTSTQQPQPTQPRAAQIPRGGFAVIDVETTGLSPQGDRILEMAILRTDCRGWILDEWVSRFNPQGPVGATHIHGIAQADVASAPVFAEVIPELNARLAGLVMVAHNARFDLAFLRTEFARAGWALPLLPSLCTLDASRFYLPDLDRRRLPDCCAASGIQLHDAHSAMGDAGATARLLASYLDPQFGYAPLAEHLALPTEALAVKWPTSPGGVIIPIEGRRVHSWRSAAPVPPAPKLVELIASFSLIDALEAGAPEGSLSYLETLATVLHDGQISTQEATTLGEVVALYELSPVDIEQANRGFLLALAHGALDDGKVSQAERAELYVIAELLGLDKKIALSVLDRAEVARHTRLSEGLKPLPAGWSHGEALRVGDKVAFTGCEGQQRERLEQQTTLLGVRVMGNVSRNTVMLVSDGSMDGTKAACAAELGTRVVQPDEFEVLLKNVQPEHLGSSIGCESAESPQDVLIQPTRPNATKRYTHRSEA